MQFSPSLTQNFLRLPRSNLRLRSDIFSRLIARPFRSFEETSLEQVFYVMRHIDSVATLRCTEARAAASLHFPREHHRLRPYAR